MQVVAGCNVAGAAASGEKQGEEGEGREASREVTGGIARNRGERDRNQTSRHRVERVDGGADSCGNVCVCVDSHGVATAAAATTTMSHGGVRKGAKGS